MKICTIIGARPQFIKAAALSAKFAELRAQGHDIEEIIIHTGQHYDAEMSKIFFTELKIPKEKYNLKVGSASHALQTAKMLEGIEEKLLIEKPDCVLIYGDTNSTLAGALVASKLKISVVHVEAGMRSFNRDMPEEINRIVADHIASINFCSSKTSVRNLENEGLKKSSKLVGDLMFDTALIFAEKSENIGRNLMKKLDLKNKKFILMTCHRAENTDAPKRLREIISAANEISRKIKIIFPIHPRTRKILCEHRITISKNIATLAPLSYLETIALEKNSLMILTDSGGMQKEAFFLKTPCVTMRDETEWTETAEAGMNVITGADKKKILSAFAKFAKNTPSSKIPAPYGNGHAADKIAKLLLNFVKLTG
jgi:UDP-GlcNAc3NAcA epimerase